MKLRSSNTRFSFLQAAAIAALSFGFGNPLEAGAILYGVTGDGGARPEVFFEVSTTDATTTFIQSLGNGDDGESIAFRPSDGFMYHWSGFSTDTDQIMETINLLTGDITDIPTDFSAYDPEEVFGSTYDAAGDRFLITDINGNLTEVTSGGIFNDIGALPTDGDLRGIAFNDGDLYVGDRFTSDLYQIDPLTGGAIGSRVMVTLANFTVGGINALTTDPGTGNLYAILKVDGGDRRLAIVDPFSGIATDIGLLPDGFANIEFGAAVPEPTTMTLFALGLIGLAGARKKRSVRN